MRPLAHPESVLDKPALDRTVVLVGLMGAGKTSIGQRLARRLGLAFVDADHEIELAANCTISEIFARHGEAAFRTGERRVIARLLDAPPHVLATGGGAFMDASTRERIRARGISVWLRADIETLVARVGRRSHRPLLAGGDPRAVLERLIAIRHPIYAEADIVVDSQPGAPDGLVETLVRLLPSIHHELRQDASVKEPTDE